jgi:hypothetical protein
MTDTAIGEMTPRKGTEWHRKGRGWIGIGIARPRVGRWRGGNPAWALPGREGRLFLRHDSVDGTPTAIPRTGMSFRSTASALPNALFSRSLMQFAAQFSDLRMIFASLCYRAVSNGAKTRRGITDLGAAAYRRGMWHKSCSRLKGCQLSAPPSLMWQPENIVPWRPARWCFRGLRFVGSWARAEWLRFGWRTIRSSIARSR